MSLNTAPNITQISIEEEMKSSYLQYAMSVIVSRAIPDVRDGLKPVHRRILYAMEEAGNYHNKPYRKSARTIGDVVGKFHPHGEGAIYEAMVRMAQPFSMRSVLVDGQGNFGSMDGDPAAAMRYTEARLSSTANFLVQDLDKNTVDFKPNYDDREFEPVVLPARFPNILVNGAGGIAVAMATNIPTHNLAEVLDVCCAYINNPEITLQEMLSIMPGPDLPTGGIIMGRQGLIDAYKTGRGSFIIRSQTHIEELGKDREAIIVTEIPYQVNKARMIERMAELVNNKTIEGISDLRDESDRRGVRVVIELKKGVQADIILNQLYRHTPLQVSFGVNMLALHNNKPVLMGLKEVIQAFIEFREEVVTRRVQFELAKAREKAHLLIGLGVAVANIDEIIALIRAARDPQAARQELLNRTWALQTVGPYIDVVYGGYKPKDFNENFYRLTEPQVKAILDLRLHRLTGLEREKILEDLRELAICIQDCVDILNSRPRLMKIVHDEFVEVKNKFALPRLTQIQDIEANMDIEDLIQREDMVITVSHRGYIKRVPLSTYRAQKRGGKGRSGMATREEDFVTEVFVANTHTPVLFFSSLGQVYQLKVYKLPLGNPQSKGKAMINLLPLQSGETISTVMLLPEEQDLWQDLHIMFATSKGHVRRNALSDFVNIKANGKMAMRLAEGEELISVHYCDDESNVLLTTAHGKCIRFPVTDIRQFVGRSSTGVRGIKLAEDDRVVSMSVLKQSPITMDERDLYLKRAGVERRQGDEEQQYTPDGELSEERYEALRACEEFILSVTENGFGKRTSAYEYRPTHRGGQGFANIEVSPRNGLVISSFPVKDSDEIVLVTDSGKLIRCPVNDIRIAGRRTQGVTLLRTEEDEKVVSVTPWNEDNHDADAEI